tara:strand:- start:2465 stop:2995 length:531 start_codon:yes stop_codon:yes gene_type:complete
MEIKKIKAALAAIVIMGLTFTACSGDDGEQGPAGAPGNANVQPSNYTVMVADWTAGPVLRDTLNVPAVTQAVVDNGAVHVYQKRTDSTSWEALPFSYIAFLGGNPATLTFQFGYNVGEVHLSGTNSFNANVTPGAVYPGDRNFKVVVIPSTSLIEGIDVNDYEQVKMVYGIEEYDM